MHLQVLAARRCCINRKSGKMCQAAKATATKLRPPSWPKTSTRRPRRWSLFRCCGFSRLHYLIQATTPLQQVLAARLFPVLIGKCPHHIHCATFHINTPQLAIGGDVGAFGINVPRRIIGVAQTFIAQFARLQSGNINQPQRFAVGTQNRFEIRATNRRQSHHWESAPFSLCSLFVA